MYERDVSNVADNVASPVPAETGANGAFCKAGSLRCKAFEYAVVDYLNREVNLKLFGGFRSDLLNDKEGAAHRGQVHREHAVCDQIHRRKSRNQLFFGMDFNLQVPGRPAAGAIQFANTAPPTVGVQLALDAREVHIYVLKRILSGGHLSANLS